MLNFQDLKIAEKANTRASSPKGQNWDFRFKISEKKSGTDHLFYVSDSLFKQLDLENVGLVQFEDEVDGKKVVGLLTVDNDRAVILKASSKGVKGKKFKAEMLANALDGIGIISNDTVGKNQYLTLEEVSVEGAPEYIHAGYIILADEDRNNAEESDDSYDDSEEADLD